MSGEKEFRKWIVMNAPKSWLLQSVETTTGTGVPDLFFCVHGYSGWMELKSTTAKDCYMRISQWRWFNKLTSRGGYGLLLIKRLKEKRVDVYDVSDLVNYNAEECKLKGNDITFPPDATPMFSYKMGSGNGSFYSRLEQEMEKAYA